MEVAKTAEEVKQYWPKYKRRAWGTLLMGQLIIILTLVVAATYFGLLKYQDVVEYVALAAITLVIIGVNAIVFTIIIQPLSVLSNAITHVAGEKNGQPLPNPNEKTAVRSGLRPLLQTIYHLSSSQIRTSEKGKTQAQAEVSNTDFSAFSDSAVGIAILDTSGKVLFHNKTVPVHSNTEGGKYLQLEFYTDESIESWLQQCESNTVRADKTWVRVASKPAGQADRKLYDIIASYRKGSETPLIAFFIERTDEYSPEEEDL
ncbi:MAG TPA: hypothetical protein VGE13_00025, partial [Candidatus Saccharimonadales bacterium]